MNRLNAPSMTVIATIPLIRPIDDSCHAWRTRCSIGLRRLPAGSTLAVVQVQLYPKSLWRPAIPQPFMTSFTPRIKKCCSANTISSVLPKSVEHLAEPRQALESLWALLVRGGWLGIMTKLVIDQPRFSQWHYKNDPTHISYFSRQTFIWLADFLGADLEFVSDDAILLRKRGSTRRAWVLTED